MYIGWDVINLENKTTIFKFYDFSKVSSGFRDGHLSELMTDKLRCKSQLNFFGPKCLSIVYFEAPPEFPAVLACLIVAG